MTRSDWAVVLVSAPVVVLAIAWLVVLALAFSGEHPIWRAQPRNLSEAAAFRDGGAIVRRVWNGEQPTAAGEVRAGIISDHPVTIAPLEAAIDARRPDMLQLLLDVSAALDASSWTKLWCRGADSDVRGVLWAHRPLDAAADCSENGVQP